MKRCPKCNREYADETLRFCFDDGTPLIDLALRDDPPKTQIMNPRPQTDPGPSIPTIPSYSLGKELRAEQKETRRSNPVLIVGVIVAVLLLAVLVGIAGLFAFNKFGSEEPENANSNQSEDTAKKRKQDSQNVSDNTNEKASPQTTPATPSGPLKITASASSVRLAVQSYTYYPANAIDGQRSTAWIEGAEDGPGLGEWIRFDFDREINLRRILFQPGYFKSQKIWAQNNRLATVTAQFSDGSSRDLSFADTMESQKIDIGSVRTRWVRFVIKSVYYGTDPDTALSEIAFEWDQ